MIKLQDILNESDLKGTVASFESSLMSKYPQIDKLGMYIQSNNVLFLSELYIKKKFRGEGYGSNIMRDIIDFADKHNLAITLVPEPESLKKSAVIRLVDFYKRFGFVINKGKHMDYELSIPFSMSMYRLPKNSLKEEFEKSSDVVSNPENNERTLNDILVDFEKSGGKVLGVGSYGKVLYHPKWKFVLKIFANDNAYLSFVRFVIKNPRTSFPKFYDKPRRIIPNYKRGKNEPYLYVVKTELLNDITTEEFKDIDFYKYYGHSDFSQPYHQSYVWLQTKKKIDEINKKYPSIKTFINDYNFLEQSDVKGAPDFHQRNIMKRDNGEFVLIDPFWEGETPYQRHDRLVKSEIDYDDYDDNRNDSMIKGGELYKKPKPLVIKKDKDDNTDDVPF